jgi:hypothetical protein
MLVALWGMTGARTLEIIAVNREAKTQIMTVNREAKAQATQVRGSVL